MLFHDYWRSSAAYRCRIAFNIKGFTPPRAAVNLAVGAHRTDGFGAINPQRLVPALELDDGVVLTQSLAIIEWLEETHPAPPLLPQGAGQRAAVRAFAQAIACDIHPVNNLRILTWLRTELGQDEGRVNAWYRHWVQDGLAACEALLARTPRTGPFCFGAAPSLADVCLVPQMFNARRFDCDLSAIPGLVAIEAACAGMEAFAAAHPARQPDAV